MRLEAWLGVNRGGDARAWLAQQSAYDMWQAEQRFKVAPMRVHPEILQAQRLPDQLQNMDAFWQGRYQSTVNLEKHLHNNGTKITRFFLLQHDRH